MNSNKLIKEYLENDELNMEKIVQDYSNYIRRIITNNSKSYFSNEDIEEIVADTFFILWKNKDKLYEDSVLKYYLSGITKNLIKEKSRITKNMLDIDDYIEKIPNYDNLDFAICERQTIDNILRNMKNDDLEIFQYFYYYDMPIKEISKKMKLTEFSVKSKLYRIRRKLRKELEEGGYKKNG